MPIDSERFEAFIKSKNVQRHMLRFADHMPGVDDTIVSILKGHLLIEEQLFGLINVKLRKPVAIKDLRFSFQQILCIAESLTWYKGSEWAWESIGKLNSIRNGLAHRIDPPKLNEKIEDFLKFVERCYPPEGKREVKKMRKQKTRILFAIGFVYSQLSCHLEACKNTKKLKEK